MSTRACSRSWEVTGVMLCFQVLIHPEPLLRPLLVFLWMALNWSSYKLGLSSKGSINTLTPFMRVIKQPLLGIRGSRLGRDCPGWLMSRLGMELIWEPWSSGPGSTRREGGGWGTYWVLDSLVKQSQINLLCNGAATWSVLFACVSN